MRSIRLCAIACTLSLFPLLLATPLFAAEPAPSHGIAMHGDLKYPADFTHFDYVNPNAPQGGELRHWALGSYDSFHPFVLKGNAAAGLGRIYETLMVSSADEPFSMYGLLAESIQTPDDRSRVVFTLRAEARWHDGKPVTADDVVWTFHTLIEKGLPHYKQYYGSVRDVRKLDERRVEFVFRPGENRELPLILGQLVVLPRHYWKDRDFESATLDPPLGSGPYRIDRFDTGRYVTYRRVEDYWGAELPVNVGRNNVDVHRHDYYRDSTVALEAFKAGAFDIRQENSAKNWATQYDIPALREGLLEKAEIPHERPAGMQGFVFNIRRELFRDRRVRWALAHALDFEWANANLFHGQYTRTRSYFDNSELAARGLPGPAERALLEPHREKLPEEVFTTEYVPPKSDASGNIRAQLRKAVELLRESGWRVDEKTRKLTHSENGRVFSFEILLVLPEFERVVLPFAKNLERLGIDARVRTVDSAQYERRVEEFDYDMIVAGWGQSLSPGNEQRNYWSSAAAGQPGSQNYVGIADPVIDELIEKVIAAPDRDALVARVRALDRVLQWGHYVIPNWHIPYDRIAYWDKLDRPEKTPLMGAQLDAWWVVPEKAKQLKRRRQAD